MILGIFHKDGVDLDGILSLVSKGFSRKEGFDPTKGFILVSKGLEVYGKDTHVYRLLVVLWICYSKMDEICVDACHFDFDRSNPLSLALVGYVIIFAWCLKKLMMWCLNILPHEICELHYFPSYSQVVSVFWRFKMLW